MSNTINEQNLPILWDKIRAYTNNAAGGILSEEEIIAICDFEGDPEGDIIPVANRNALGCVAVGDGINVDDNGVISTDIDKKMNKENPTGTGSFSLNRKAGTTIGDYSFASGSETTASGIYSHAEGDETTASAYASHAEGMATIAIGEYQHVQGKFNLEDMSNSYAHIVGGGNINERKNIHTLEWNGNAWYNGNISTEGSFISKYSLYTGGKTAYNDGLDGVTVGNNGRIYITSTKEDTKPGLLFYGNGQTTAGGSIIYNSTNDTLEFNLAERYYFTNTIESDNHMHAAYSVAAGGKTRTDDGKTGVMMQSGGSVHIQATTGNGPYIAFYKNGQTTTSSGSYIQYKQDATNGELDFRGSGLYDFDGVVQSEALNINSVYIGYADTASSTPTRAFTATWKDGSGHYLLSRASDGLTANLGWAGSSSYETVTTIRARTVKCQNSSGTTTLSDERLKKDFVSLDRWDKFFDNVETYGFKLKTGSSSRYHIGYKSQQIEQALLDGDLSSNDFAGFIKMKYQPDEDDPETSAIYEEAGIKPGDDEYGLIYTEFTALNTYQIQQLKKKYKEQEIELQDTKAKLREYEERFKKLEQALNL